MQSATGLKRRTRRIAAIAAAVSLLPLLNLSAREQVPGNWVAQADVSGFATAVTGFRVEQRGDFSDIVIDTNGREIEFDNYPLDSPPRLVIDVRNVRNESGLTSVDPGPSKLISSIRVVDSPDRVRIIVELTAEDFEPAATARGGKILISLAAGGVVPQLPSDFTAPPVAAAPVPEAPVADELPPPPPEPEVLPAVPAVVAQAETPPEPAPELPPPPPAPAEAAAAEELIEIEPDLPAAPPPPPAPAPVVAAPPPPPAPAYPKVTAVTIQTKGDQVSVTIKAEKIVTPDVSKPAPDEIEVRMVGVEMPSELVSVQVVDDATSTISKVTSIADTTNIQPMTRVKIALRSPVDHTVATDPKAGTVAIRLPSKLPSARPAAVVAAAPADPAAPAPAKAADLEQADTGMAVQSHSVVEASASTVAGGGRRLATAAAEGYTGTRMSLEFREADIRDVLSLIAEVAQLNLIASPEVKGNISIVLKNVPWDQALDIILETNGLGRRRVGNVIRIAPKKDLQVEEEARLAAIQQQEQLEPLQFQIIPVNYADAGELSERVKQIMTPRGTVSVDTRSNSLLVQDTQRAIDKIVQTVRALDTQTGQILLEARVVTTTLDFQREFGIQWGGRFLASPNTGNSFGDSVFRNNFLVDLPVTAVGQRSGQSIGFSFGTLSESFNLDVVLSAFEQTGQSRIIATPRISVIDNNQAEIKTGVSVPITTFRGGSITTTFVDATLGIKVTPQITSDKSVILKLEISDNQINPGIPTAFGNPAINKNEAKSQLLVRDGQTAVIGGVARYTGGFGEIGIPYLSKIPLLGYLFRTNRYSDQRTELLFFITPTILME